MARKKPEVQPVEAPEAPSVELVDLSIEEQTGPVIREPVVDEPFPGIKRVNF